MGIFGDKAARAARRAREAAIQAQFEADTAELHDIEARLRAARSEVFRLMQDENASNAQKWEYKFEDDIEEDVANERGARGWELASFASYTNFSNSSKHVQLRYAFKRPVSTHYGEHVSAVQRQIDRLAERKTLALARIKALREEAQG